MIYGSDLPTRGALKVAGEPLSLSADKMRTETTDIKVKNAVKSREVGLLG